MTSPFYASCIEGATPVAEANGYDLLVMSPPTEDDYATQMSMMEDMITRGVAGIAVCGINLDALIPGIQKANEAGIPVVMFNTITELEGADDLYYKGRTVYGLAKKAKARLTATDGKRAVSVTGKRGAKAAKDSVAVRRRAQMSRYFKQNVYSSAAKAKTAAKAGGSAIHRIAVSTGGVCGPPSVPPAARSPPS